MARHTNPETPTFYDFAAIDSDAGTARRRAKALRSGTHCTLRWWERGQVWFWDGTAEDCDRLTDLVMERGADGAIMETPDSRAASVERLLLDLDGDEWKV